MFAHNISMISRIAKKEVTLFFASPIAYLFLATFAAVTLFVFFWGEAFFSRNIADVRPMFEWMPILLIFLASTLTMRLWSEERRTGTLEYVLTQPIPLWHFIVGKFVGCLALLLIALLMTLPLPIMVEILGDLDWGPVLAGYIATFLLGAAYLSIGLFVSSQSDNQIVSLISAVVLCSLFYLCGNSAITDFFGTYASEWLRLLGTGSRFDSITRGVIDFRDLFYYVSIVIVFLALNTFMLEKERWAKNKKSFVHKHWKTMTALIIVNAIVANFWLVHLTTWRIDTTQGQQYSISDATYGYVKQLQEPLLLRGYFSAKTHPLLAPLVPQLRDLMQEYEIAGDGKIRVEFIDPASNPEAEEEANQVFGIQPTPFQIADRYQSAIVSSYFNVLVQYGNESQVIGFQDLIEVLNAPSGDVDIKLRNPEHDVTQAIKKVLNSFQASGNLFETVKDDIVLNAYISDNSKLPESLVEFKNDVRTVSEKLLEEANGKFTVNFIDPDKNNGVIGQEITQKYGLQPMTKDVFSQEKFYFYLTLSQGDKVNLIAIDEPNERSFRRNLDAGIKRFGNGFTKKVGLVIPNQIANQQFGLGSAQFRSLEAFLGQELSVEREDLSSGYVDGETDILLLAAPTNLNEVQVFAIDQFLMKGGTVLAATSPYAANLTPQSLDMKNHTSGIEGWLNHHGISFGNGIVLDPQNTSFPIPVVRNVGGTQMQEMQMIEYPYFSDIRDEGLNADNPISDNIPQLTMAWSSPILIDSDKNIDREIIELFSSSKASWVSSSLNVLPQMTQEGLSTFSATGETTTHLLGAITEGSFVSYFKDKTSPLQINKDDKQEGNPPVISSIINRSASSARIVVFSSNDFLSDQVIQLISAANNVEYLNSLQLINNAIDWSLEDSSLLSIRSRGQFNRTLPPVDNKTRVFWEYFNYVLAALMLGLIAFFQRHYKKVKQRRYEQLLDV